MKQRIREEILGLRGEIPSSQKSEHSHRIFQKLIGLDFFKTSQNIMAYVAFRNEVDTLPVIRHCLSESKRIIVPMTVPKTRELLLSELKDPERDLRPGTFGVPEPARVIGPSAQDLDLILVPGWPDEQGFESATVPGITTGF